MAPIHHHFQEKGYSESKIAYCYAAVTALMGLAFAHSLSLTGGIMLFSNQTFLVAGLSRSGIAAAEHPAPARG